ncbi:LamG-like jellyroll fold domain-containing protein, partial [Candidatus Omnitrophota bacterium]
NTLLGINLTEIDPEEGLYIVGKDKPQGLKDGYQSLWIVKGDYARYALEYSPSMYNGYSNSWMKNFDTMLLYDRHTYYDYSGVHTGYTATDRFYPYVDELHKAFDPVSSADNGDYVDMEDLATAEMLLAAYRPEGFYLSGKDFDMQVIKTGDVEEYVLVEKHIFNTEVQKFEKFQDTNGNRVHDATEEFEDLNSNEIFDAGEFSLTDDNENVVVEFEFYDNTLNLHYEYFLLAGLEERALEEVEKIEQNITLAYSIAIEGITVNQYSLSDIRGAYAENPFFANRIMYEDDPERGESFVVRPYWKGEKFVDVGNGSYDAGEAFVDANGNGIYDEGETYFDEGNLRYDETEDFTDTNENGLYDLNADPTRYNVTQDTSGAPRLQYDVASTDVVVRIEFTGDTGDGSGITTHEMFYVYDNTFDEAAFIDYLKLNLSTEHEIISGSYTVKTYGLNDLRRALIKKDYSSQDEESRQKASELVVALSYTDNKIDGETFFIGEDRYRVVENTCNTAGEDIVIIREKSQGAGVYDMSDYVVSAPVKNMFRVTNAMYTAVHSTDPLGALPEHAGHEKYYYVVYDENGQEVTNSVPNTSKGTWQVEIDSKTYDLVIDGFSGKISLVQGSKTSDPVKVDSYEIPGGEEFGIDRTTLFNMKQGFEETIIEAMLDPEQSVDPYMLWHYQEVRVRYDIVGEGQTRYGEVTARAGGEYDIFLGEGITPQYLNTVKLQDDTASAPEPVYLYYDIFTGVDLNDDGEADKFYVAYNMNPGNETESPRSSYATVEFTEDMTVIVDGARYKGYIHRDKDGYITSISLSKIAEVAEIRDGLEVDGEYVFAGHLGESYTANVGSEQNRVEFEYFGDSYYPKAYITEPLNNTVVLDDGKAYEVVIDPTDPARSKFVSDNIISYRAPSVMLGGIFYIIEEVSGGHYLVQEAYDPSAQKILSQTEPDETERVQIGTAMFKVESHTDSSTGREWYSLEKLEAASVQESEVQVIGLRDDVFYKVLSTGQNEHIFINAYNPADVNNSVYADGHETVELGSGEVFEVVVDESSGKVSLIGSQEDYVFKGLECIIDGKYYQITKEEVVEELKTKVRYLFNDGATVQSSDWSEMDGVNLYRSLINFNNVNYAITVDEDGKIALTGAPMVLYDTHLIDVNGTTYVALGTEDVAGYNSYRLFDGDRWYNVAPATSNVRLDDGTLYKVIKDSTSGRLTLQEPYTESHDVQSVNIDGKIFLAHESFDDSKHGYRFYDGYGNYISAQDTFGFYQDGEQLFNNYEFYSAGSVDNFEGYNKSEMEVFGFTPDTQKYKNSEINYRVNISQAGIYDVGLFARTYKNMPAATLDGQDLAYQFTVSVDGIIKGSFLVRVQNDEFAKGSLPIYIPEGEHELNLVWSLPSWYNAADVKGELSVEVKNVFVAEKEQGQYDLDHDMDVDKDDLSILKGNMTASALCSQDVPEKAVLLGNRYYSFYYDARPDKEWYVVSDGQEEHIVQKDITGDLWVTIGNILYRVVESEGSLTLYEDNAGIISEADQVMEINGVEYMVFWQDSVITFKWSEGQRSYDKDTPEVILSGKLYKVLSADPVTKKVDLKEIVLDARPLLVDTVEVANDLYTFTIMENDTVRFVDAAENEVTVQLDGVTKEGEVFLAGVLYNVKVALEGALELTESIAPILADSATRINLGGVEYMVMDKGDGLYVIGRLEDAKTYNSTDGAVEIFDGEYTSTYYIYKNPTGDTIALFKDPIRSSASSVSDGTISITRTSGGESIYAITKVGAEQNFCFTDINDPSKEWVESSGTVEIEGITYEIVLEEDQVVLQQMPIASAGLETSAVYVMEWRGYSAAEADSVADNFSDGKLDGWQTFSDSGAWSIVDNMLYQGDNSASSKKAILNDSSMDVPVYGYNANSSISTRVDLHTYEKQYSSETGKVEADLYAGYLDDDNYYRMNFAEDNIVTIYRKSSGVEEILLSVNVMESFGINIEREKWETYTFGVQGDGLGALVEAAISGVRVAGIADHSASAIKGAELVRAKVGLGCAGYNKTYFDDVKIGGLQQKTVFYDVTAEGEAYVFEDGIFMPIVSEIDSQGQKIFRTHRVIELEGKVYMVTHEASTDTYYLENAQEDTIPVKLGEDVSIEGILYNVSGTSADDIRLSSIDASDSIKLSEKVVKTGDDYYIVKEETPARTPLESERAHGEDRLVLLPDPITSIEEGFDDTLDDQWNLTGGVWEIENGNLYQRSPTSSSDGKGIFMFKDAAGGIKEQTDQTVNVRADPYDSSVDLYVRYKDEYNFYRARFDRSGSVVISRRYDGAEEILASVSGIDIAAGAMNELGFSARGSESGTELKALFGGKEILSIMDDSEYVIPSGHVGFGCPPRTRTYISDFTVDYVDIEKGSYYVVSTDAGGKYVLTDKEGTSYVEEDTDKSITVGKVTYAIDDTTEPGKIIFTEEDDDIISFSANWIELEDTYYKVTSGATTGVYILDDGINTPFETQADSIADIGPIVSEWSVIINAEEYAVGETDDSKLRLFNNQKFLEETSGHIILDAYRSLKVTGRDGTLTLARKSAADLNSDGVVTGVDEEIIASALAEGIYDWMADLDADGDVDASDLRLFRRWRFDTEQITAHSILGEEYQLSKGSDGIYTLKNILTGEEIRSSFRADGTMFVDIAGVRWTIEEAPELKLVEDTRLYTANDGEKDLGSASLIDGVFSSETGRTYRIGGTGLGDVTVDEINTFLAFDGDGDYVTIPDNDALDLDGEQFTVEAWINIKRVGWDWMSILGKSDWDDDSQWSYSMFIDSYGTLHFDLMNEMDNGFQLASPAAVGTNMWRHVAATYDGSKLRLYIDGEEVASQDASGKPRQNDYTLQIGAWKASDTNFFNGSIDDVRIWNKAKQESQIQDEMNSRFFGNEEGLVAYYTFDGDTEEIVKDSSLGGIDGQISNARHADTLKAGTSVKGELYGTEGDLYVLKKVDADWVITNGKDTFDFDANSQVNIDGKVYELEEDTTGAAAHLIWPVSESRHIKEQEITYRIDDTDPENISLLAQPTASSMSADKIVALATGDGRIEYYTVSAQDGEYIFTDGTYPPIAVDVPGLQSTATFDTHRVIELEGAEYRVTYDTTTTSYALYYGIDESITGLVSGSAITIGEVTYQITGTDADDFKLTSVTGVVSESVPSNEKIINLGTQQYLITESLIQSREPIRPAESQDLYVAIRGTSPAWTEATVKYNDFNDATVALDGFLFPLEKSWKLSEQRLYQYSTSSIEKKAIYAFEDHVGTQTGWRANYSITTGANLTGGNADIYLRYTDDDNFYRLRFDQNDLLRLERMKSGRSDILCEVNAKTEFDIDINKDDWYELTFKAWGNTLVGYINGEEVIRVAENANMALTEGYAGVGCAANSRASFDNVEVKEIVDLSRSYYKVHKQVETDEYIFTEVTTGAVYTSTTGGTLVEILGTQYEISETVDGARTDIIMTVTDAEIEMKADLNSDGMIDQDDETIIFEAIASGTYTSAADINKDTVIDDADLAVFLSQRFSSREVACYSFQELNKDTADYFVSRTAVGTYFFEKAGDLSARSTSDVSGQFMQSIGSTNYIIDSTSEEVTDVTSLDIYEDTRIYNVYKGGENIAQTSIAKPFESAGNILRVIGTGIDNIKLSAKREGMEFDGLDDYISLGNPNILKITGSQTISMWLKPQDLTSRMSPYSKAIAGEGSITVETDGTVNYYYGDNGWNSESYAQTFTMTSSLTEDQWTHITIVRDLENMELRWYKDGVLINKDSALYQEAKASGYSAYIGRGTYSGKNFDGLIDDVAIYNSALSSEDVFELCKVGVNKNNSNLVAYYPFEGGTAEDKSMYDNHGTIQPRDGGAAHRMDIVTGAATEVPMLTYNETLYKLEGSAGAWKLTSASGEIIFDQENIATVGDKTYVLKGIDTGEIYLEGPISESIHSPTQERTYIITGTDIEDLAITEIVNVSQVTGENVVGIKVGEKVIYYTVSLTPEGDLQFTRGTEAPVVAEYSAGYTTITISDRTIELEGTEYRLTKTGEGTYALDDGVNAPIEGISLGGMVDIGGVTYAVTGTDIDDLHLASAPETKAIIQYSDLDYTPELLDQDNLMITASVRPYHYSYYHDGYYDEEGDWQYGYYDFDAPRGADLYLRYQNESNFYRARFQDDDTVEIQKMTAGSFTTLASCNVNSAEYRFIDIPRDEWSDFSFSALGNELKAYINGQEVLSVSDTASADERIEKGYAGVGTPPNVKTYFDDVRIYKTDAKEKRYFDITQDGSQYTFTDTFTHQAYNSNAAGDEVTIDGVMYSVTLEETNLILAEQPASADATSGDEWVDVLGSYYKVTDTGGGSYIFSDGSGDSFNATLGDTVLINGDRYQVTG